MTSYLVLFKDHRGYAGRGKEKGVEDAVTYTASNAPMVTLRPQNLLDPHSLNAETM